MKDTEEAIYETLSDALLAGRLSPGVALRETALAELFGTSRERIRKILLRLGTNKLIDLVPNRGAFVAAPSLERARDIYDARRIIESGIVTHIAPTLTAERIKTLEEHMARETQASESGDRASSVRLSAQFHMILADATDNLFIIQQMQELVSRTSMLVAVYEASNTAHCSCEEHRDIFTSLLKGDGPSASRAMSAHLSLIETRLRPGMVAPSKDAIGTLAAMWVEKTVQAPAP